MRDRNNETKPEATPIERRNAFDDREIRSYSPRRTPLTNNPPPRPAPKPIEEK